MRAAFLSYAFLPQAAPRAVQVARLAKYSSLPIKIFCAGSPGDEVALRQGVEVIRFHDGATRAWRRAKNFIYLPDSERPWAERAARTILGGKMIKRADVLITFGQPMSDHLAGLKIKKRLGLPWIAHFSDPWSDSPYLSKIPLLRSCMRRLERKVVATADRLLFTSMETLDLTMRKYPTAWRDRAGVLPHAFDPAFERSASPPRNGALVIRHLGNFYGPRNPIPLAQALALLQRTQPRILNDLRIELVGRWLGNESWSPVKFNLPPNLLQLREQVSYEESLRLMCAADALLIIDAPFEHNVFFPSKLVEYLWARRPILALTPPGPSADIVTASGGMVASPATPETIANGLLAMLTRLRDGSLAPPSEEIVGRYDARAVAAVFDRLVLSLQDQDRPARQERPQVRELT